MKTEDIKKITPEEKNIYENKYVSAYKQYDKYFLFVERSLSLLTTNVHSMDRLARNTKDLLNLVEHITDQGAKVVFHKENLTFAPDKQDPYQKMMMTMLGAVAELERNLILERQREGIALAKLHGKYKGGQHKLTNEQAEEIKALVNNRTPITAIAKQFNVSRRTIYNYL